MKRGIGAAVCALALALAGCGDDGDSETLTKAQFVKRADAICQKAEDKQVAGVEKFQSENSGSQAPRGRAAEEQLVVAVGIPPLSAEADELKELPLPETGVEQAEAVVDAIGKAVKAIEEEPTRLLGAGGKNYFEEAEELARKYGLEVCGSP